MADKKALEREEGLVMERTTVARPSTDANIIFQLLIGLLGAIFVALAVIPLKGTKANYLWAVINDRGPVQYAELFMAFMAATFIFLKTRIIRSQLKVIARSPVDPDIDLNDDEQIQDLRNALADDDAYTSSIVLNRADRMLALWLGSKDVSRVATWDSAESERTASASDATYSTVRILLWAIPILGFIGTVMGLGGAISGFGDFLSGSAELTQIKDAIGTVTQGLGVAFDTTLLALVLSVFLMFPLTVIQRKEEDFLVEVDSYLDEALLSHFPAPEQQPIVIENLEDAIEAAFRRYIPDPDRYDEVFTRSIDRASSVVEERFTNLATSYQSTLHNLTGELSSSVSAAGDSLQGSMQRIVQDLQAQEQKLLDSRRDLAGAELDKVKAMIEESYKAANRIAGEYQKNASAIEQATRESSSKTIEAAGALETRMDQVRQMAAGIQDLLQIEKTIEKSLEGISTSENFQNTLKDLREHLNTTDAFCKRLSRPRVITLKEEISG